MADIINGIVLQAKRDVMDTLGISATFTPATGSPESDRTIQIERRVQTDDSDTSFGLAIKQVELFFIRQDFTQEPKTHDEFTTATNRYQLTRLQYDDGYLVKYAVEEFSL